MATWIDSNGNVCDVTMRMPIATRILKTASNAWHLAPVDPTADLRGLLDDVDTRPILERSADAVREQVNAGCRFAIQDQAVVKLPPPVKLPDPLIDPCGCADCRSGRGMSSLTEPVEADPLDDLLADAGIGPTVKPTVSAGFDPWADLRHMQEAWPKSGDVDTDEQWRARQARVRERIAQAGTLPRAGSPRRERWMVHVGGWTV